MRQLCNTLSSSPTNLFTRFNLASWISFQLLLIAPIINRTEFLAVKIDLSLFLSGKDLACSWSLWGRMIIVESGWSRVALYRGNYASHKSPFLFSPRRGNSEESHARNRGGNGAKEMSLIAKRHGKGIIRTRKDRVTWFKAKFAS